METPSTMSPFEFSYEKVISRSGMISATCLRNARESVRSILSTKYRVLSWLLSPLTAIIWCLRRVVISNESFGNAFFNPWISLSIFISSLWVNNLKVTVTLDWGRIKSNSFLPLVNNSSLRGLFSNWDKLILTGTFAPYLSVISTSYSAP